VQQKQQEQQLHQILLENIGKFKPSIKVEPFIGDDLFSVTNLVGC